MTLHAFGHLGYGLERHTIKDLLKLMKNSEADLFIIQLRLNLDYLII